MQVENTEHPTNGSTGRRVQRCDCHERVGAPPVTHAVRAACGGANGELRDSNVGPAASGGSNQRSFNSPLASIIMDRKEVEYE
jgi:hypothetical protein